MSLEHHNDRRKGISRRAREMAKAARVVGPKVRQMAMYDKDPNKKVELAKLLALNVQSPGALGHFIAEVIASWKLGEPIGHIAVLLTGGQNALAYENTRQERGVRHSGFNRLTRVDELTLLYPGSWEAYRIPEDDAAAEEVAPDLKVDVPIIDPPPVDPPDLVPDPLQPDVDTDAFSLDPPKLDPLKPFKLDGSK